MRLFFAITCISFLFYACSKPKDKQSEAWAQNIYGPNGLSYVIMSLDRKELIGEDSVSVSLSYPIFLSSDLPIAKKRINRNIRKHFGVDSAHFQDKLDKTFTSIKAFKQNGLHEGTLSVSIYERVLEVNDSIISMAFESSFPGLRETKIHLSVLSSKTGKTIGLQQYLGHKVHKHEFSALAKRIFTRQNQVKPNTSLFKAGFLFPGNRFVLARNWAPIPEGILFHYNPGEIRQRQLGGMDLIIPFDSIRTLSKK